jgi:pyruvate/2-oxoglutarate dehydrogenase complex dihydrolipoamide dehydrogenase (E3) component
MTYASALNGASPLPREVVIVGGGAIGCELALHLAETGHGVTVMEMLEAAGAQYEAMTRKLILDRIHTLGIKLMTRCRITRLEGRDVLFVDPQGEERAMRAGAVIMAIGTQPENGLYRPLLEARLDVHKIGDCLEPRGLKEAMYEGALVGRSI